MVLWQHLLLRIEVGFFIVADVVIKLRLPPGCYSYQGNHHTCSATVHDRRAGDRDSAPELQGTIVLQCSYPSSLPLEIGRTPLPDAWTLLRLPSPTLHFSMPKLSSSIMVRQMARQLSLNPGQARAPFPFNCFTSQMRACRARATVRFAQHAGTCSRLRMTIAG
jgi:hypothetical protein